MKKILFLAILLLASSLFSTAFADDTEDAKLAVEAYFNENGDDATILLVFQRLSEKGNPVAQYGLSMMYSEGAVVSKDEGKAFKLCELSARTYPPAMNFLGMMYSEGKGVGKNEEKAFQWFKRAAENGSASGMNNLRVVYLYGVGTPKDEGKNEEWTHKYWRSKKEKWE